MENEKQIVLISDIKHYLLKAERRGLFLSIPTLLCFGFAVFTVSDITTKVLFILLSILMLSAIAFCAYTYLRIQNNRHFTIKTDVLASKRDDVYEFWHSHNTRRLYFQKGYYSIYSYSSISAGSIWCSIYTTDMKTIYDTAFIGDTFTLICVGKKVILALNNKFYEIENDI